MAAGTTALARPLLADRERAFAWANAVLALAFTFGLMVDLWAHNNVRPLFETFFTVWHAVLYGSFGIAAAFLAIVAGRAVAGGAPLARALPAGYGLSGIGAAVFAAGGVLDLTWHTLVGIEAGVDAIVSPSHLVLATGGVLLVSGPLRSSRDPWAVAVSMLSTALFALPFLTLFEAPYAQLAGSGQRLDVRKEAEIFGSLTFALTVLGVTLYALRSVRLPRGALGLVVAAIGAVSATIAWTDLGAARGAMLAAAIAAGVAAETAYAAIAPDFGRPARLIAFGAALPVALLAPYLATLLLVAPPWWSAHAVAGSIALPSAAGALLASLSARSSRSL
ncbi:MAG TPA: hypothetical protein VFM93_05995 [Candidatus Limnocylindria bacterium]|nr:hypothetical protein [Candidatus Limnocylindria bacterium]